MNRETLNELHELTKKVEDAKNHASELLRVAKDRFNHVTHKLMREGKEVELTEKVLWEETFLLGTDSEAGKILTQAHPEVFEAYKNQNKLAADLKKFGIVNLGINYEGMTLSDYIRITEGMFELLFEEKAIKSPYMNGKGGGENGDSNGGVPVEAK